MLGLEEKKVYILRRSNYELGKKVVDLLLVDEGEQRHYAAIKSLSRVAQSSNTKHKCKQHFCMNCLQGLHTEISRDKYLECCKDNEKVRIEMRKEGLKFHDGQYQFKVPFNMYVDFEAILKPIEAPEPNPEES